MKIFALSDVHVDYPENLEWLLGLCRDDYREDILILAGDISHDLDLLRRVLEALRPIFHEVLFIPGNHELWVAGIEAPEFECSLAKFHAIGALCAEVDVHTGPRHYGEVSVVPLLSWYDFSFGAPGRYLRRAWRDFRACRWPRHLPDEAAVAAHFLQMNTPHLAISNEIVITCSHFLPRIDVMPSTIPDHRRQVYPVLGCAGLDAQVRQLDANIHVYGHSHVNQSIQLGGTRYINNAFAYPSEARIARKQLHCVWPVESER